jgi:hypothetical protein
MNYCKIITGASGIIFKKESFAKATYRGTKRVILWVNPAKYKTAQAGARAVKVRFYLLVQQ